MTLSAPVRFATKVPFPPFNTSTSKLSLPQGPVGQIGITACSEYTKYHASVDYFKKNGKLRLVHDTAGKPVVFVINKDNRLCVLQIGVKQCEGWQCTDITPAGLIATTYDVMVIAGQMMIAVACNKPGVTGHGQQLCFSTAPMSQLDAIITSLESKADKTQGWILASDNKTNPFGTLALSSVLCMINGPQAGSSTKFQIVIGTEASNQRIATLYTVDPHAAPGEYWSVLTYPAAASAVAQVEPLVLGQVRNTVRETGLLSRFTDFAANASERLAGHVYAKEGGIIRTFEMKTERLGGVRGAFSHLNPWGLTDIFVAGEKGIGYYSFDAIDVLAADPVLPEKSFVQVIASEAVDPLHPQEQTKIAIFALSDDRSLYYIEGTRNFQTRNVSFKQSGLPIRESIYQMSTMYSASYGTSELLYTASDSDMVRYMRRNADGNLWTEDTITSKSRTSIKFDAFVTTITLTDSNTQAPAVKFPIKVSTENLHVIANGITYVLGSKPTTLYTDPNGSVTIVVPSDKGLGCPALTVSVEGPSGKSPEESLFTCQVEPSGRVDRLLGNLRTADDLKQATSASNTKPFQDMNQQTLDNAAAVLGKYGEVRSALASKDGSQTGSSPAIVMGSASGEQPSFWQKVTDTAIEFLGDAIEFVKKVVKTVVKAVIVVVGPVVRFLFKVAGKWISFQIKILYNLLSVIGTCLKDVFGWDGLNKLLEYLRLAVDPSSIIATQKVIKSVVVGSMELTGRIIDVNRSSMTDMFDAAADFLHPYISDPREAPKNTEKPAIMQVISDVLNNPFVKLIMKINPIEWIMEAVMEEVPGVKVPSITAALDSIKDTMGVAAITQLEILDQALRTFLTQVQSVLNDPSKFYEALQNTLKTIFWTLFDSLGNFAQSVVSIMTAVVAAVKTVLDGVWKIPGVTDLWEDLTGQDFSILNFMTFGPAVLMNFVSIATRGKLPFDKEVVVDFSAIEVKPFYRKKETRRARMATRPIFATETSDLENGTPQMTKSEPVQKVEELAVASFSSMAPAFNMSAKAGVSSLSAQQHQVSQAGFSFPRLNIRPEVRDLAKHIFQMIKYFAFAADNGYTIVQTVRNLPQAEENPESWLNFFKLAGNFIASLMLVMQGLPDPGQEMDFSHGAAGALGLAGTFAAGYALVMTRTPALNFGKGNDAESMREQQLATAKVAQELSRWLGWIATAIQVIQSEDFHEVLTYGHLMSPILSAGTAVATYFNAQNAGPEARAALILALILALGDNTALGIYHGVKAIQEM